MIIINGKLIDKILNIIVAINPTKKKIIEEVLITVVILPVSKFIPNVVARVIEE